MVRRLIGWLFAVKSVREYTGPRNSATGQPCSVREAFEQECG